MHPAASGRAVQIASLSSLPDHDLLYAGKAAAKNVSSDAPTHLYIPKSLFREIAAETNCSVEIKDHAALGLTYSTAPYRYTVYLIRGS